MMKFPRMADVTGVLRGLPLGDLGATMLSGAAAATNTRSQITPASTPSRAAILIVDDNPVNLQLLGALLEQAGYKVRPALSGEVALRSIELCLPDLILLDIRMPDMDGYETCKRLSADARSRDIPVIFISATDDIKDRLASFRSGGVDFVSKPFQPEEVLARVKTHLQLFEMKRQLESLVAERTRELSRSEARYRVLFEANPLAVMVYDVESGCILAANNSCSRLIGYTPDKLIDQSVKNLVEKQGQETFQNLSQSLRDHSDEPAFTGLLQLRHGNGQLIETEGVLQNIDYSERPSQILMLQDVSELRRVHERLQIADKEYRQQLEKSVHFDALTGLPNRMLLEKLMRQGVDQAQRSGSRMAVCHLDIDAFKSLNEIYGARACDLLLSSVADRLRSGLRGGDTVARIGGDDFVVLLLGRKNDCEIDETLQSIHTALAQPFTLDTVTVTLSACIGIAVYPHGEANPDTLLRHAGHAMMLAKQRGKGICLRFDPDIDIQARVHKLVIDDMRLALSRREFILYYQPKINLKSNVVFGAEALIRWQHPQRGLLGPCSFLPDIEDDDFIVELGDWVLGEALRQKADWNASGLDLSVSVNVAARQLTHPSFMNRLRAQLAAHPIQSLGRLEIEVLETSELQDMIQIERIIADCRELGVGFSLDDFGTGYSSLTYLRRLSADTLKIDQSFVCGMLEDCEDQAIVAGVIGLATAFQRKVIAEGVETVAHGKALYDLGCELLQGYGIARPMPAQDMPVWVSRWPSQEWAELVQAG